VSKLLGHENENVTMTMRYGYVSNKTVEVAAEKIFTTSAR